MSDWRYSEERMKLRQEAFLTLKPYLTLDYVRSVYEFCDEWVSQGNKTTRGIEDSFLRYCENKKSS